MKSWRIYRALYSATAIAICVLLLIAVLIAAASEIFPSRRADVNIIPPDNINDGNDGNADTEVTAAQELCEVEPDYMPLITDPGGAYAVELYDSLYFTENGEALADGEYTIVSCDLSPASPLELINETSYTPDTAALLADYRKSAASASSFVSVSAGNNSLTPDPVVLIIHTHGTEGYAAEGAVSYSDDNMPRSTDITQNVVAVGEVMRDVFIANGIPALHCEIMHDAEDYNMSYRNSLTTVLAYLEKYPSIRYVFDVHRDALISNGEMKKCVCELDGGTAAQVMLVVGTDAGGADYPNWRDNLSLALALEEKAAEKYPGLMRAVNLRKASFNAQYSEHALLIEVGTCANTLAEAKSAASSVAQCLAEIINNT